MGFLDILMYVFYIIVAYYLIILGVLAFGVAIALIFLGIAYIWDHLTSAGTCTREK
jgi:hypothetical protein